MTKQGCRSGIWNQRTPFASSGGSHLNWTRRIVASERKAMVAAPRCRRIGSPSRVRVASGKMINVSLRRSAASQAASKASGSRLGM